MPKSANKNTANRDRSSSNNNDQDAATLQTRGIERPTEHDVLQGRGGQANNWIGNKTYRAQVDARKAEYVQSVRAQKTAMSRELVRNWRALDPPGRFLEQDSDGLWHEIGDKKARRKTSQLLREDAPIIRERMGLPPPQQPQQQQQQHHDSGTDSTGDSQEDDDEWVPKGAARQQTRRASTTSRSKEQGKEHIQAPRKPSPPKMASTRTTRTNRKATLAKGPSSLSKRDLMKNGTLDVETTALKPPPEQMAQNRTPPTQIAASSAMLHCSQGSLNLPPSSALTNDERSQTEKIHAEVQLPPVEDDNQKLQDPNLPSAEDNLPPFPTEDQKMPAFEDTEPLPIHNPTDQRLPIGALEAEAFANTNSRDISWGSMALLEESNMDTNMDTNMHTSFSGLLGDLESSDIENFEFGAAPLEPLDFETRANNAGCWEGNTNTNFMEEDNSERRFGDLLMAGEYDMDFSH